MEKLVRVVAVACGLIGPLASAQAVECPAALKHPYVQRVAEAAIRDRNVQSGTESFPRVMLRIYRTLEVLRRGPALADVQAGWDELGNEDAVAICFPQLRVEYLRIVEAAQRQAADEEAAEERRRIAAEESKEAQERRRIAAEEAAQERRRIAAWEAVEAAKPRNRLLSVYANYVIVKQCHDQRDGYIAVYINDTEIERAREAMGVIEKAILAEDPSLPATEMWAKVSSEVRVQFYAGYNWSAYTETCRGALATILGAVRPAPAAKDF
jgi:hypothetical protein